MLGRCRELLALGDFGVRIGFDEIGRAVGGEAKVDAGVAVELQDPVDAFRRALNAGAQLRREILGRPVDDSDALLIVGIVFGFFGGDVPGLAPGRQRLGTRWGEGWAAVYSLLPRFCGSDVKECWHHRINHAPGCRFALRSG